MTDQLTNGSSASGGCPVAHGGAGDLATRLYGADAALDPHGIYGRLRKEHGAVAPVLLEGDVPAWLVLGYRENRRVLDNPRQFSRDSRIWRDWKEGRVEATSPLVPMLGWRPDCVSQDGEPHRRLRGAVTDNLQTLAGRGIRRHVTHFANRQIDAFADAGSADLVGDYAEYLPMLVLTRLFGLPAAEGHNLAVSCAQVIKGGEGALAHNDRIMEILGELAERKRAEPGSDFTTGLLGHEAGLDGDEILSHLRLVLITAHTTTSNLLARVLQLILTDTSRLAGLVSGQLNITTVVEEVMWNTPPLAVLPGRFATADLELAGHHIKEGDLLVLGLTAGNLDPEIRPDTGVSIQGNQSHLAFSGGAHECPGQNIGQAIIETAVDVLVHRLPGLRLAVPADDLTSTASTWEARLDSLPVEFAAQTAAV
ncbi:cytochrome P450 [Streptomyces sp. NPDC002917]|uniref:cytochrome P450 n=1 Tax=unclassified Streptomyces TaxID=2593676 RepID=UPI002E7FBEEB|nr:cytochrome P450 [Streptomyces sp. NBC_00562]WTC76863.1 cytochrome P450 [Streptomyces sp. NBC_01653]WTD30942.1 cytochrome P450 [Streptomyces sp. NBC_01643]WTD86526.1 cytochrome P450 [Streptomyces sp. NBC_01637]WTF25125.1 cytochrome P450 [Streptomyces sp. NBC_01602]WTC84339.1 cytochrome P450 [Streptomyces sp. NBC_01653]